MPRKIKKTEKKKVKKKSKKLMITQGMTLSEVVSKHPETIEVFLEHGMGCFGCGIAQFETVKQGAEAHGIDGKKLINALNKAVSKKKNYAKAYVPKKYLRLGKKIKSIFQKKE